MNFPTALRLDLLNNRERNICVRILQTIRTPLGMPLSWKPTLAGLLCNSWTLLICKLIIGLVSAYDIYLTVKYFESLPMLELNPVGRWLMSLDQGPECKLNQIAGFIASKFTGNFISLAAIELVAHWRYAAAVAVALSLAGFQLLLLGFLIGM